MHDTSMQAKVNRRKNITKENHETVFLRGGCQTATTRRTHGGCVLDEAVATSTQIK